MKIQLKAVKGCQYVIHTTSPYPFKNPKNEDDVLKHAVESTRVTSNQWKTHKIRKIVVTSLIHSIIDYNNQNNSDRFYEGGEHPEIIRNTSTYDKSKIEVEEVVKTYVNELNDDEKFDVVILSPGFMIGPLFYNHHCTSGDIFVKILLGWFPGLPDIYLPTVDVRDVVEVHYQAIVQDLNFEQYIIVKGKCLSKLLKA